MDNKTSYRAEHLKTACIVLLMFTLVGLTALNFLYDTGGAEGALFRRAQGAGAEGTPDTARTARVVFPYAAAVRRGGALTGAAYDAALSDALYGAYETLLGTTLASARDARSVTEREWTDALGRDGVFFAFGAEIPAWLLAGSLSQTESAALSGLSFESLLLQDGGGGLELIARTPGGVWAFGTPLARGLPEFASELPDAAFAFELGVPGSPDRLFTGLGSSRPVLEAGDGMAGDAAAVPELLAALNFNPNTDRRYTKAGGEQVFVDNTRVIHISPGGLVSYSDSSVLNTDGPRDNGPAAALNAALAAIPQGTAFWGEGRLALRQFAEINGGFEITLSYELNGALVADSDSVFTVRGGRLHEARIRLRPLYAADDTRDMLPQRQAAVLLPRGARLAPAYAYDENEGVYLPYWKHY